MVQPVTTSTALRWFHFVVYLGFRICERVIRLFPIDWVFGLGKICGEVAYHVLWRRRGIALSNLRLAFGRELSESQLRALNREHFRLLGGNLGAGLKAATMTQQEIWQRITTNVPDQRGPSGWIALISHIGSWELYSHLTEKFPEYRFGALYQPLANPFIDRYLRDARTRSGIKLFDRRTELLSCVRFLRDGGVVGVLADQAAGYAGVWTPLFGRLTSSSTFPATLSIRTGLPVVPIAINTCGHARWHMTVSPAVYPETDDPVVFTAEINRLLEEQIRRAPADWLWVHKRWKPLRPHFLFSRDQRRVFFPENFDMATLDPFRILIVSPISADEARKIVGAVKAIRKGRPDAWLCMLANGESAEYWTNQAEIERVIVWDRSESAFSIAGKLREVAQFDAAIAFEAGWRTSLALFIAGIPVRVGLRSAPTRWLYNQHPAEPEQQFNPIRLNLHIAHSVGADINEALIESARSAELPQPV